MDAELKSREVDKGTYSILICKDSLCWLVTYVSTYVVAIGSLIIIKMLNKFLFRTRYTGFSYLLYLIRNDESLTVEPVNQDT